MHPINKPWWEQVTALVSLSVSGAITGFSFVPHAPADLRSPSGMPIHLLALDKSARPARADDAMLRSAIINVTNYFLRMAATKTPAEMEAIIWHHDSIDGVDHGESCAAFASLTLELASQAVGQQSWVTGGTTYPWPLHKWADVRVDPNPDSPGIVSVQQDAQAHQRWHPLGDGYRPRPGDWVLFDGHVEVVTKFARGVLDTVGGDSLPNFSVNAHSYHAPLAAQGVVGFVNNGELPSMTAGIPGSGQPVSGPQGAQAAHGQHEHHAAGKAGHAAPGQQGTAAAPAAPPAAAGDHVHARAAIPGAPIGHSARMRLARTHEDAAIPGLPVPGPSAGRERRNPLPDQARNSRPRHPQDPGPSGRSAGPRTAAVSPRAKAAAAIPGLPAAAASAPGAGGTSAKTPSGPAGGPVAPSGLAAPTSAPSSARSSAPYGRHLLAIPTAPVNDTRAEQAFINQVAAGAIAAQRRYGVPASVTIAQAIDESGWGLSSLATNDHNLFGIKGAGPAGSDVQATQEYQNGQLVTLTSPFRVYHNIGESINDHGQLLATSPYYRAAMAHRHDPNAFAAALTGVYATDPQYGAKLIGIMQRYDLYRYDSAAGASTARGGSPPAAPRATTPASSPHVVNPDQPGTTPGRPPRARMPNPPPRTAGPAPPATSPSVTPQPSTPAPAPSTTSPNPTPRVTAPGRAPATLPPRAASRDGAGVSARADGPARASGPAKARGPARAGEAAIPGVPNVGAGPAGAASGPASAAPASNAAPRGSASSPPTGSARPAAAGSRTARPQARAARAARPVPSPRAAPQPGGRPDGSEAVVLTSAVSAAPTLPASPLDLQKHQVASHRARPGGRRYRHHIPPSVWTALVATAKTPLVRGEPLYADVADHAGIRWELLAACDWMQCKARPGYSPVRGEKLGTVNPDGTSYHTKSEALEQCAEDLIALAQSVYRIDLTAASALSVRDLACVFAAFRWGGLLRLHHTSAMEFPYSVAGLTVQHTNMRWPKIDHPHTPDKPGSRFRMPFGAVPIVLGLDYPATA